MNNRIIKFRLWNGYSMEIGDCELGIDFDGNLLNIDSDIGGYIKVKNRNYIEKSYLMQFTGLTDKNGKEIYEGDIVNGYWQGAGDDEELKGVEICWNTNGWRAGDYEIQESERNYEVIGNQFESPELLN